MPEIRAKARRLKATLLLDLAPFAALKIAELVGARTALVIEVGDRKVRADIATKSLRKACVTLAEHGPEATVLVLQGELVGDRIDGAGLVAQVRVARAETEAVQ